MPFEYDPMLGKLIVSGSDRTQAIARLSRALSEYEISGVETTLPLFRRLMEEPDFVSGAVNVQWLERRLSDGLLEMPPPTPDDVVLAAVSLSDAPPDRAATAAAAPSHWRTAARAETRQR